MTQKQEKLSHAPSPLSVRRRPTPSLPRHHLSSRRPHARPRPRPPTRILLVRKRALRPIHNRRSLSRHRAPRIRKRRPRQPASRECLPATAGPRRPRLAAYAPRYPGAVAAPRPVHRAVAVNRGSAPRAGRHLYVGGPARQTPRMSVPPALRGRVRHRECDVRAGRRICPPTP